MKITEEILEQGKSPKGAWGRKQLRNLGVPWPLKKGWKSRLIGKEVPDERVAAFLKGEPPRIRRRPYRWEKRYNNSMVTSTLPTTVTLTPEQSAAVDHLLRLPRQVQTLGGYAGTGKTTVITTLIERLPRWAVCAYTGKAVNVLRRKGVAGARTIHSLIYDVFEVEAEDDEGNILKDSLGNPLKEVRFAPKRKAFPFEGILVDEASMVGEDVQADLAALKVPIIYVGDHGQLPPVMGRGNLMERPDVALTTLHRNAGPIARFAEHLRGGGDARRWRGGDAAVRILPYSRMGELEQPDQVICAFNRTRVMLNAATRGMLGYPEDRPVVGDRVMCLENSYLYKVFNGQQGTIKDVDHSNLWFEPEGEDRVVRVPYVPEAFGSEKKLDRDFQRRIPFDYCYAVTCHKAQGDEWGSVAVLEQRCDRLWSFERWAYTAASRAREQLTWITP